MLRYTLLSTNISEIDIIFTIYETKLNVKEKQIRFIAFKGNQSNPLSKLFKDFYYV